MKIKIGEKIRSDTGIIDEVVGYDEELYKTKEGYYFLETDIVKHSKNIIDLVEVYDFVNGFLVFDIITYADGSKLIKLANGPLLAEKDIETILTKELYQANCYTVERKEEC